MGYEISVAGDGRNIDGAVRFKIILDECVGVRTTDNFLYIKPTDRRVTRTYEQDGDGFTAVKLLRKHGALSVYHMVAAGDGLEDFIQGHPFMRPTELERVSMGRSSLTLRPETTRDGTLGLWASAPWDGRSVVSVCSMSSHRTSWSEGMRALVRALVALASTQ